MAEGSDDRLSIGARHLQELREAQAAEAASARAAAAAAAGAPTAPGVTSGGGSGPGTPGWWEASDGQWYPPEARPSSVQQWAAPGTPPSTGLGVGAKIALAIVGGLVGLVVISIIAVTTLGRTVKKTTDAASGPGFAAGTSDGFVARFPTHPKRTEQTVSLTGLEVTVVLYDSLTSDEEAGISLTRFPSTPDPSDVQRILDGAVDGGASKTGATVVSRGTTTFVGVPAEDAVMTKSGAAIRVRVFLAGPRLFTVTSVTRTTADARPGYDRLVASFTLQ
ncbi:MAG: hypothetical protein QOG03_192 [Actinomycetota bacterium]|jgi:hypothetical protein|nr:hypothetical protein [Actinomycetota bacterium]